MKAKLEFPYLALAAPIYDCEENCSLLMSFVVEYKLWALVYERIYYAKLMQTYLLDSTVCLDYLKNAHDYYFPFVSEETKDETWKDCHLIMT